MPLSSPSKAAPKVAFIGFGEAAQAFCTGWKSGWKNGWKSRSENELASNQTPTPRAFDIKTGTPNTAAQKHADYRTAGIAGCASLAEALAECDVIFSMVTADQALSAAQNASQILAPNTLYFDCNSVAPETKRSAALLIEAAGGRYVDVALMAPVHPKLHQVPVLASGPHHAAALEMMARLDMSGAPIEGGIGAASSIKMVRSIMVKGLEALMAECLLAGRRAGVEDIVFDTLDTSYPGFDFRKRAAYGLDRMIEHGERRAAEMREVALTVEQLGLDSAMSRATTEWQQAIGELGLAPQNATHTAGADAILAALPSKPETTP